MRIKAAMMEKIVQQMAQGAGCGCLETGKGTRTLELCNPRPGESNKGELLSVSSSRMSSSSSSTPELCRSEMVTTGSCGWKNGGTRG